MDWTKLVPDSELLGQAAAVAGGVSHDSRLVEPGGVFVAVPGLQTDGHDHIAAALAAGAALVVVQRDREALWRRFAAATPLLVVPDSRATLGAVAAAVYGEPSRRLRLVGVTGTDGKTTTSHLIGHVLDALGYGCGYLSSAGFDLGGGFEANASHMTTLEASSIQAKLAAALAAGRRTMVVEASSEGLAQSRLRGCEVDVAVFTNLTRDHLDFHGTMSAYLAAKGLLFEMLDAPTAKRFPRVAVLNADDAASVYLRERSKAPALTYAIDSDADLRAADVVGEDGGLAFRVRFGGEVVAARLPLVGRFNVANGLAAVGVALSQGSALADAAAALASFPGVPGRLESIDCGQPFRVIVDIASTPAALESVLVALRPLTAGRLSVVFGAAGGRDAARRFGLGEVAGRLADRAVVTNEDPRDEAPEAIFAAIEAGLAGAGRQRGVDYYVEAEREKAMQLAFKEARAGDTVLLAGKATETTMVFAGGEARPWDERAVARALLGEL